MTSLALVLAADLLAGDAIEVVVVVRSGTAEQQILLFPHHILAHVFSQLEIRSQLDGMGRAGLLAETTHDATREVDAEIVRIPAPLLVFGLLQRDAVHRTRNSTQVAGYAALLAVRVTTQDNAPAPAGEHRRLHVRVLNSVGSVDGVHEYFPQGGKLTAQATPDGTQHHSPPPCFHRMTAPLSSRFSSDSGSRKIQP